MAQDEAETWKKSVLELQQLYYEMLGDRDWDCYRESEIEFLERNVGHAMFGPPEQLPDEKENGNTGYKAEHLEQIRKVISAIKEHSKYPSCSQQQDVWMSVVFVCLNIEDKVIHVPVFRIPHHQPEVQVKDKSNYWFVDTQCRVYQDWDGYLKNNTLPKCSYCYPVGGVYIGDECDQVMVQFGQTPACSIGSKLCNVLDTASTVVTVGGMAVAAAGMFATVAAPVAVASIVGMVVTGVYGVGRSAAHLVDRGKHKQSVGIKDAESRGCWLSVAGNSLGIASSQAIRSVTKMAQQGRVLSSAGRLLVNTINFGSLTVNGLGLLNHFVTLREKAERKELKPLDVFQFASSVLFFTMSAVNVKTADTIIRETQKGVIGDFEDSLRSNRHRRQFRRLVKSTQSEESNSMQGNARVIRGIRQISDKDDFFAGLVRVRKQFAQNNAKVVLTDSGLVEINGELCLHPMKFWEIDKIQRKFILDATKNLNQGLWTQERFNQEMNSVCQEPNLAFRSQQSGTDPNTNHHPDADVEMSLRDVSMNQLPLSRRLCQFAIEHRRGILQIARNLAEMMGHHKTAEIIKIADFLANYVEQVTAEFEAKYQEDLRAAQTSQGENFNREDFDRQYNIQGNRHDHFIKTVLTNYNTYEAMLFLKQAFHNLTDTTQEKPSTSQPDMEPAELTERVKQFAKQHRRKIISIAINLCDILGLRSTPELIHVTDFVASFIEKVLSEMEITYQESLKKAMEQAGQGFNREEFDKKYNIDGERTEHFVRNVISNYENYEQLKQLKAAYEENCMRSRDKPEAENMCLYSENRDFEQQGELSDKEMYNITQQVTGLYLFEGNTTLLRDGHVSFVTITDPNIEQVTVVINSDRNNNIVTATMIT